MNVPIQKTVCIFARPHMHRQLAIYGLFYI
ncbi:Uncharacterised protein [Vibrio cholerae]|nr:Uncharacterised protein [Vibrio cholerae]